MSGGIVIREGAGIGMVDGGDLVDEGMGRGDWMLEVRIADVLVGKIGVMEMNGCVGRGDGRV